MRLFIVLGLIGLSSLFSSTTVSAACTNKKLFPLLGKLEKATNLSGETVLTKMPRLVGIIVNKCKIEQSQDLSVLETQKQEFMRVYDALTGPSGAMVNYCTTLRGTENISACFEQQLKAEKALNLLVKKAQDLYWDKYDKERDKKAKNKKAALEQLSRKLLKQQQEQQVQAEEILKALKSLNDIH